MLELLVSVLIFSFGMLGLAGLQTRALSFNQSSLLRTQATALTDDILDRMRADRANALAGRWDTAVTAGAAAMANTAFFEKDLRDWKQQVEALLPSGQASVVTDLTAGPTLGTVTITVQWDDTRGAKESLRDADAITRLQTVSKL
jgi:type IV pilus assembly protein PilV